MQISERIIQMLKSPDEEMVNLGVQLFKDVIDKEMITRKDYSDAKRYINSIPSHIGASNSPFGGGFRVATSIRKSLKVYIQQEWLKIRPNDRHKENPLDGQENSYSRRKM